MVDVDQASADKLPTLLSGFDGAHVIAKSYLRSAIDAVIGKARNDKQAIPLEPLLTYLSETKHDPMGRRFAFDLIASINPEKAKALVPTFVNDPSIELRRDAIEQLIATHSKQLEAGDKPAAREGFLAAVASARDFDQVKQIVQALRKLEVVFDVNKHFGYINDWHVIGPFTNADLKGYETEFPPKRESISRRAMMD